MVSADLVVSRWLGSGCDVTGQYGAEDAEEMRGLVRMTSSCPSLFLWHRKAEELLVPRHVHWHGDQVVFLGSPGLQVFAALDL